MWKSWSSFSPKGILERNDPKVRLLEGLDQQSERVHGEVVGNMSSRKTASAFVYDLAKGQKTGSFLDQRENHWPRGDMPRAKCWIVSVIRADSR